jgi:lysozyme
MASIGLDRSRPSFADVNHRNPVVDWTACASAASLAGALGFNVDDGPWEDPTFRAHLAGAEVHGLVAMGRVYSPAGIDEFLAGFPPRAGRVPVLDFDRSGLTPAEAETWIERVNAEWGRYPFFFGRSEWVAAGQPEDTLVAACPYWGPQEGQELDVPRGVGEVVAHRFTDGRTGPEPHGFPGVLDHCGVSSLVVSPGRLRKLAGLEFDSSSV